MDVCVVTLSPTPDGAAFDDGPLRAAVQGRDVASVFPSLTSFEGRPALTLVLGLAVLEEPPRSRARPKVNYSKELRADDFEVYEGLRAWRNERARHDGVSPFLVFTNRELAQLAVLRPKDAADLIGIDGIGERKAARFGSEVLDLVPRLVAQLTGDAALDPPASPTSEDGEK